MLALTLGLLLLASGAAGRLPLVGPRINNAVAAVGAILSLVGLGHLVVQKRADQPEKAPPSPEPTARAA